MIYEIILITIIVSAACAIPGVFLVLRKMSLMSDAISHSVLPGIVVGFLITHSLSSPLLFIGAVLTGMITVFLSELLVKSSLVKEDASICLVFPVLFSIGVILVSRFTGNVHLDTDAVLLGELVFTPLNRFSFNGIDLGPKIMWVMGCILILNILILLLFFKELKLATFDRDFSKSLGFSPSLIHYILMIDVSITTVGAFDAVGSILVVALIIAPASAAYLLTDNLKLMIILSIIIGIIASVIGFLVSWILDASAAGAMAGMCGVVFFLAFLFSPSRGMFTLYRKREAQKIDFAVTMLTVHLMNHRNSEQEDEECCKEHLLYHINWDPGFAKTVVAKAKKKGLISTNGQMLLLTPEGEISADKVMVN